MNLKFVKWFIILSFVFDAINTILQFYNMSFERSSVLFRAISEAVIIIIFIRNKNFGKFYLLLIFLSCSFAISYLIFLYEMAEGIEFEPFIILNKYYYFIVLSLLFINYQNNEKFIDFITNAFKYYLIFNSIIIIMGFIFNIELFSSYFKTISHRFGYKGLIPAQNEATGVYFFGMAFIFRRYFVEKKEKFILVLIVILASLLIGTKGIWITIFLLLSFYILKYKRQYVFKYIIPITAIFVLTIGVKIWNYIFNNYLYYFNYFVKKTDISWLTILLSGRDIKTLNAFNYINSHYTIWNYLFGGLNLSVINSETDLIDGYFLLGINFIIYLYFYIKIFLRFDHSTNNIYVLTLFIILAATGGHLIYSAIIPLFYLMYIFSFNLVNNRNY